MRPPGLRWGYSGEGFVILQRCIETRTGTAIDETARELVFEPLGMRATGFGDPEPGYHGFRPLLTTAHDYALFLAHVLAIRDARWEPQVVIDDDLAWGLGWGLELEPPVHAWQWGANADASNFVIGCPSTGAGIVVFTDAPGDAHAYRPVVRAEFPGRTAAVDAFSNANWLKLFD